MPKKDLGMMAMSYGTCYVATVSLSNPAQAVKAFLEADSPEIDMKPEDPYWSGKRSRMSLAELLAEFDLEYSRIAAFVESLSEEQLSRKAHIPMLKDSPLGEYPTLAQWAVGLSTYHIGFHIEHMHEILQALGLSRK